LAGRTATGGAGSVEGPGFVVERDGAVRMVLESHFPALLASLRPHEDPESVMAAVWRAVEDCAAKDVPFEVQLPLLAATVSSLPATVAALVAGGVRHVRVVDASDVARWPEARGCFTSRYIDRTKALCEDAANVEDTRFVWDARRV
jgi:hypothetical protein